MCLKTNEWRPRQITRFHRQSELQFSYVKWCRRTYTCPCRAKLGTVNRFNSLDGYISPADLLSDKVSSCKSMCHTLEAQHCPHILNHSFLSQQISAPLFSHDETVTETITSVTKKDESKQPRRTLLCWALTKDPHKQKRGFEMNFNGMPYSSREHHIIERLSESNVTFSKIYHLSRKSMQSRIQASAKQFFLSSWWFPEVSLIAMLTLHYLPSGEDSPVLKPIFRMNSISDEELVSICIFSLADRSGRSIVAMG